MSQPWATPNSSNTPLSARLAASPFPAFSGSSGIVNPTQSFAAVAVNGSNLGGGAGATGFFMSGNGNTSGSNGSIAPPVASALQQPVGSLDPSDFPALGAMSNSHNNNSNNSSNNSGNPGNALSSSGGQQQQQRNGTSLASESNIKPVSSAPLAAAVLNGPPGLSMKNDAKSDLLKPDLLKNASLNSAKSGEALKSGDDDSNNNNNSATTSSSNNANSAFSESSENTQSTIPGDSSRGDATTGSATTMGSVDPEPTTEMERFGMKGLLSVIRMENNDATAVAIGSDLATLGLGEGLDESNSNHTGINASSSSAGSSNIAANANTGASPNGNADISTDADAAPGIGSNSAPGPGVIGVDGTSVSKTFSLGWHGAGDVVTDAAALDFLHHPLAASTSATLQPPFTLPQCYKVGSVGAQTEKLSGLSDETLFFVFYAMPRDTMQELAAQELVSRTWRYHKQLRLWLTKDPSSEEPRQQNSSGEQGTYIFFDPYVWEKTKRDYYLDYSMIA